MMGKITLRQAEEADKAAIRDLSVRAFGQEDEANIVTKLEQDQESYLQVVAENEGQIVGHLTFFILRVKGKLAAMGMGPMCVDPWVQKEGIGKAMIHYGMDACKEARVPIVFVLGHPEYFPRFGFTVEATDGFESPFVGNPAFMAMRLQYGPPMSGKLLFPEAFGI